MVGALKKKHATIQSCSKTIDKEGANATSQTWCNGWTLIWLPLLARKNTTMKNLIKFSDVHGNWARANINVVNEIHHT
jgi:hypothetical protein